MYEIFYSHKYCTRLARGPLSNTSTCSNYQVDTRTNIFHVLNCTVKRTRRRVQADVRATQLSRDDLQQMQHAFILG